MKAAKKWAVARRRDWGVAGVSDAAAADAAAAADVGAEAPEADCRAVGHYRETGRCWSAGEAALLASSHLPQSAPLGLQ